MSREKDPYLVPGTKNVLHNKHGITDKAKLDLIESDLAGNRIDDFDKNPPPVQGSFDQQHLRDIHRYIFQDTYFSEGEHKYPIAGAKRIIGIEKKHDPDFPHPDHPHRDGNLHKRLDFAFQQLKKDNNLQGIEDDKKFIDKLVEHTSEIWECHQFREGNSRASKVFTQQLARSTGRDIDLTKIREDKINYREAMKVSVFGNPEPLKQLLQRGLTNSQNRINEQPPKYQPLQDEQSQLKEARGTIATEVDRQLTKLKAPLEREKNKLESKAKELKTQLDQYNQSKTPLLGKSNHRNFGVMLESRLTAAKHDLYEFTKKYKTELPKLRKQAAKIAEKKNPKAVAVLAKAKSSEKERHQTQNRTKDKPRTRGV